MYALIGIEFDNLVYNLEREKEEYQNLCTTDIVDEFIKYLNYRHNLIGHEILYFIFVLVSIREFLSSVSKFFLCVLT